EDSLYSCGEGDSVNGGSDNDYVLNEGLKSYILGDKGNDTIYNEGDHVTIEGGAGNDSIVNDGGKHIVCKFGKSDGKDTFVGFNDYDTVQITSGTYSASKSGNNVVIKVSSSTLTLKDAADKVLYVVTSSGNTDTISFNTSVHDDNITSDSSIQTITNDDASKQTLTAEISTANASTRTKAIRITGNGLDNSILGGTGKDTLYGKDGNDYISGGKGNDKLYGQNGNDTLWGGVGNDTLTGGKGVDTFIYNPNEGTDTIADYQSGELVQIMGGTFTNAVFDSNRLTLNVDGGGSLIFKNVATSTEFNINNTTYHVSGNTIK
ncbi:MAG: hypothetical protein J5497_07310, partial [Selenomonadaceae bacterium]|nr:hypothetical protein [Selenomonadaceae bacterium]